MNLIHWSFIKKCLLFELSIILITSTSIHLFLRKWLLNLCFDSPLVGKSEQRPTWWAECHCLLNLLPACPLILVICHYIKPLIEVMSCSDFRLQPGWGDMESTRTSHLCTYITFGQHMGIKLSFPSWCKT